MNAFTPLDPRAVTLGGEFGRRYDLTARNNLLALDLEGDFLAPLDARQGKSGAYVGVGKLLDAAVRFAAGPAGAADPRVIAFKDRLRDGLLRAQDADGYLGCFPPAARVWTLWDAHEAAYLIRGLAADAALFRQDASLAAARRLAGFLMRALAAEPDRRPGEHGGSLRHSCIGLDAALLDLHRLTGDNAYLEFAVGRLGMAAGDDPIVLGRWGRVEGHAYDYLARCLAQLRLYRCRGGAALFEMPRRALDFLLRGNGLTVTGGIGHSECWHDTQRGDGNLAETCATAYWLFLLDALLRLEGGCLYGDLMERAIYNTFFAAQSPDGRRLRYFTPFEGRRAYWPHDTYCCPNNFRRALARLPGWVYYRAPGGVLVNLYTASRARLALDGAPLELRQETDYPNSGRVAIHVQPDAPRDFSLWLRLPRWCPAPRLAVNGAPAAAAPQPGTLCELRRRWAPGDQVDLDLPMAWRLVRGRQAQAGRAAILRGPLLFAIGRPHNRALMHEPESTLAHLTFDPGSLEGPEPDRSARPDGLACRLKAWRHGPWYCSNQPPLGLRAAEFADPDGETAYGDLPNPRDPRITDDELSGMPGPFLRGDGPPDAGAQPPT